VYRYVARGTIEERMLKLQAGRRAHCPLRLF
jgi:SNF2 family DNA or RNA helicase